ncbi:class I SAM-dependent methyltransferase [Pseudofrankia asymbiotica]|uniref:Methyltransferase type 11 domain-containing protein n=1 Tax=Pseudofrankia asymbiotica TaxID=1834516 RepID=A0A1V2I920_9ACTN|nr:methyltransferase domain-containing protein [Pseudofrankia asymbiotica]ONH28972.1 hypothetical protein BL253_17980 [Pseudofrankia asymbiotica]
MSLAGKVRGRLVESPNSFGARSREQRWERVRAYFPGIDDMRVLDLGGTVQFWTRLDRRPAHVVVVNLDVPDQAAHAPAVPDGITVVLGDACDPPVEVRADTFDLVFSNSVLEHVGGHAKRQAFAEVAQQLAPLHWVQTPNRYFPLEPHWLFPGFQFLPVAARASIAQRWPLAHTKSPNRDDALRATMSTELIGRTELKAYFPDSELLEERTGPLTKSLIAVRSEKSPAPPGAPPAGSWRAEGLEGAEGAGR